MNPETSSNLDIVDLARREPVPANQSAFCGVDVPSYGDIINCMHCGLCLPTCPTYSITHLEKHSPRGRIRLIKSIAEGELGVTREFANTMNFCLLCRACETACPAGVKYGELAEAAITQIEQSGVLRSGKRDFLRWLFFRQVFTRNWALRLLSKFVWLHLHLIRPTGIIKLMPRGLREMESMAPNVAWRPGRKLMEEVNPAKGEKRWRVALLEGCLMDSCFSQEQYDTMAVLCQNGCEVVMPRGQGCCGSLLAHNGDMDGARELAKRNVAAFEKAGVDYLIINSAGCGAFIREYHHALRDEPEWADRAKALVDKTRDVSEFLGEIDLVEPTVPIRKRATYHAACHLEHAQKVTKQPRELIAKIPEMEIVELPEASWCCGSAGIYNITNRDDSMKFLERKMDNIETTEAEIIITGNPGCMGQIQHGVRTRGLKAEVVHPVTLLREAYGIPGPNGEGPKFATNGQD